MFFYDLPIPPQNRYTYNGEDLPTAEQLFTWQQDIVATLKAEPHPSHVFWFYAPEPVGKTIIQKFCCFHKLADHFVISRPSGRDTVNIIYDLAKQGGHGTKAWLINLNRQSPGAPKSKAYSALEAVKDGTITSSKRRNAGPLTVAPTHVFVFSCNRLPDDAALSGDRFRCRWAGVNG